MIAAEWRDSPQVEACLDDELLAKSAVAAGITSDATFAGPLAIHGIAREALTLIRGVSILGALESKFRRVPFRTKVARETGTGTGGAWIGESFSTPVAATAYDTLESGSLQGGKDCRPRRGTVTAVESVRGADDPRNRGGWCRARISMRNC